MLFMQLWDKRRGTGTINRHICLGLITSATFIISLPEFKGYTFSDIAPKIILSKKVLNFYT